MKHLLFSLFILSSILNSVAQNQPVPNGDFENWTSFSYCPDIDSLEGYITYDEFIFTETGSCSAPLMAKKTTDKYTGTYALELTPYFDGTDYLASGFYSSLNMFEEKLQGVPFASKPTKLTGYYKFNSGAAGDNLFITGQISDRFGYSIGDGYFLTSESKSEYTKFEIIFDYASNDNSNPPTSLVIAIISGNSFEDSADPSTKLVIDNFEFDYSITTSTITNHTTSPINVFAANNNINFSENVSDVHVVNMIGASKIQEAASTKTLNAASLTSGLYIVTYKYNDNYFSKKIVME